MARPTLHTALPGMGWKLAGSEFNGSSDRVGTAMTHHYTMTKPSGGVPVTHHVLVDEFGANPGKYNVSYHVTHAGRPVAEGYYDTMRRHRDNAPRGVKDPLAEIMEHHRWASTVLSHQKPAPLARPNPGLLRALNPDAQAHAVGGGLRSEIRQGPDPRNRMPHLNSVGPLDPKVHQLLTGGGKGREQFEYVGRHDDDEADPIDVYRAEYQDPHDAGMNYGFTIRHYPSAGPQEDDQLGQEVTPGVPISPVLNPRTLPFSYNMTHYPAGSDEVGEFGDVTGEGSPVANFSGVGPLLERHLNVLRGLGIRPLPPRPPRPQYGASGPVGDEDWDSFVAGRNPIQGMMPDGTPVVDHFDHDFGMDEPNPRGGSRRVYLPHAVARGASGEPEVYDPKGNCVTCGRPTWNARDGGESPEWEHTGNAHYAEEYGMHGPDIPQCAECANEHDRYSEAIRSGERPGGRWHHPGARVDTCDQCFRDEVGE